MENVVRKSRCCRAGCLINSNRISTSRFEIDGAEFLEIFHFEIARIFVDLNWVWRRCIMKREVSKLLHQGLTLCAIRRAHLLCSWLIHSVQMDDSQSETDCVGVLENFAFKLPGFWET